MPWYGDVPPSRRRGSNADQRSGHRSGEAAARAGNQPAHPNDTGLRSLTSALLLARSANLEIFHFTASLYRRDQPARLLPSARPSLGRLWIAIFWKDPRIFTSRPAISVVLRSFLVILRDDIPAAIENLQASFKLTLFRRDPHGQYLADLFVERPEVIERHRLQIDLLHRILQPCQDFNPCRVNVI